MQVTVEGQRRLNPAWRDQIASEFDPDTVGLPVLNYRNGSWYIIDGQHRVSAMIKMGWGDQQILCECFEGMTEAEEAAEFLRRQKRVAVRPLDKFRIAITAGYQRECDIDRIVRAQGLRVGANPEGNNITAVASLGKVYDHRGGGPVVLGRALRIIRNAFGEPGLIGPVIEGVGLVCIRYQADLDEAKASAKLGGVMAGVNGLLGKARNLKLQFGRPMGHCVAAATVEILNQGKGGKKLASWWRVDDDDE